MPDFSNMVDMSMTPEERKDMASPVEMPQPVYPYGLCLSLGNDELEKLDLDGDCGVGDLLHVQALAKVTSVSQNETNEGSRMRVELQIIGMALDEDDHQEQYDKEEKTPQKAYGKFYKLGG